MSVPRKSRHERRYNSAADWPNTPRNDGFFWNLVAPPKWNRPDPARPTRSGRPRTSMLDDGHDEIPDHVWDQMAEEAAMQDRIERYGFL